MQIDRADRGFSFQADGPLDMRMSKSGLTAAEFLNSADEAEIARVLRDYGEEPRARAIARAIVAAASGRAHRRACGDRSPRRRLPPGPEERPGDPHLPGDPDSPQCRARRARAGTGGGRALTAPRRAFGRRHLPQPRGPDREALLPRTQRRNAGRLAPPSRPGRPERTDVRAGRQAGFPDGARAGGEPARPLGAPSQRGPDLRSSTEGNDCNERATASARCSWSPAAPARRSAAISFRSASRRSAPRSRMSRRGSCSPSATCACSRPRSGRAAACRSSSAGTPARSRCRRRPPTSSCDGSFELASLTQPEHQVDFQAPVVLASAPAPEPQKPPIGEAGTDDSGAPTARRAGRTASRGKPEDRDARGPGKAGRRLAPATGTKSTDRPVTAAKPAQTQVRG